MNRKERVRAAASRKQPDRIPANFEATPYVTEKVLKAHGWKNFDELLDRYQIDMVEIKPDYIGKPLKESVCDGFRIYENFYGCIMKECVNNGEAHSVVYRYPFGKNTTVRDVLNFEWVNPDMFDYESIKRQCTQYPDRALIMGHEGPFQLSTYLMNMETLFEKMILEPDVAHALYDRFVQFELEYYERILIAGDGQIDILRPHDDYGTQISSLFSVSMWKEFFAENTTKLVNLAHRYGAFYQQHSCGAIRRIIPCLVDCGVDILEPLQKVKGMEIEELKKDFGDKLCFHGGIDTQFVLPKFSPEEVKREVRHYMDVLGKDGGYILMASQSFETDVPVENIDAIYQTPRS